MARVFRDYWRRLAGGGCGQHLDGQRFAPGEEVGSRCNMEGYYKERLIMGGDWMEAATRMIQRNS